MLLNIRGRRRRSGKLDKWNVRCEANVVYAYVGGGHDESQPVTGRFRKGFFMFLFVTMYVVPSAVIIYTCVRIVIALGKPVCSGLERSSAICRMENNKRKVI